MYGWLEDDQTLSVKAINSAINTDCSSGYLSTSKLSHTVGRLSLQVATKLRAEGHFHEAYDTYRYALEIFENHPLCR